MTPASRVRPTCWMSVLCESPARGAGSLLPERRGRTLVLALGSPLRGDDGVGAEILRELAAGAPVPQDVDFVDGGTPRLETALLLQGYQRAIIIDAAEMGRRPGEWARIGVDRHGFLGCREASGGGGRGPTSVHQAGVGGLDEREPWRKSSSLMTTRTWCLPPDSAWKAPGTRCWRPTRARRG